MYESGEDYLEAILMVQNEHGTVHSVDVARKLGVSKPSVSRAMGILKDGGYLESADGTELHLTEKGMQKASDIYSRHRLLTEFLMKITGVPEEQAEQNACRVEHDIDADIVGGITRWMKEN
jgi:DtxR family transcriptional regulator, Mn-dependent transcriptional regulator